MDCEWGSVQTCLEMKVKASEEETPRKNSHSGSSGSGSFPGFICIPLLSGNFVPWLREQ